MFEYILTAVLLALGFYFGSKNEKNHLEDIIRRERNLLNLPVKADQYIDHEYTDALLVTSSVVVANDYFKTTVAALKGLLGGRLSSYETLMDRSRREAILRIKEKAYVWGAKEVVHLRIESNSLDQNSVELFASATALR